MPRWHLARHIEVLVRTFPHDVRYPNCCYIWLRLTFPHLCRESICFFANFILFIYPRSLVCLPYFLTFDNFYLEIYFFHQHSI